MSKLWDDLKKNMKVWGAAAVEKAEEVSKIAVVKTEELTKISKIKIEVHQLQRDLNKVYEDLGRFVYSKTKEGAKVDFSKEDEYSDFIKRIDELKASIGEKEAVIQNIKDEYDIKEADIAAATGKSEVVEEEAAEEEVTEEDKPAEAGKATEEDEPAEDK
ncbi:MAG: hypothetical protein GXO92_06040 [FCB group bacterium]|nr:hypothetical protein [FCB group bacterium]